ncbi:hypothetical protein EMIHUDRAFT_202497 [Emiliania huxleyi CCMP1516]|uniref:Uncharacterized protein n=2 Tax=Emiliania huxleyi TaxID=2903 RepID=A0A0D3K898_EMIH1|nr:hypothetical protein EMIHUDRAFT_202497 [Emiliania huxleyi CCMP1516]EOD31983.1 hypothetical protein EMIHUDRAFT_202497 [Emiliania huxleyi CCMP1516]|eukprot:XP_005784412.1 hypothetical protein EMIHUDRAFT_202497 [Emiliania huxleyi CCMP1516]
MRDYNPRKLARGGMGPPPPPPPPGRPTAGAGAASLGQNVGPECSAAASLSQNVGSRGGVLVWDPSVAVPLLQALALRR